MLSSATGGFFMEYKIYAAEYKWALIEEYRSRNVSMRAYCKEKELSLSTFESWLRKIRMYGQPELKRLPHSNNKLSPIDVTNEVKTITKEADESSNYTFTLETKGMKLTFSINNLKEVFEVINNG